MITPIYFDYAATTPVDPRVAYKMMQYLGSDGHFGNPASAHVFGKTAKEAIELARMQVAELINATPTEIIWTSGATEANNLALKGIAAFYKSKGKHIVTLTTEHPSVLDCCQQLEKQGFFVSYLAPKANGLLDLDVFRASLREDTLLVSIMHVNNEIGVIQDIKNIAEITASRGVLLHIDAAQSVGKIPLDVQQIPADLISFCAHKIYGPKGIGALYLRRKPRVRVAALIHGGGQEWGMRSGTLPTHQIVGMGEAFSIAKQTMHAEYKKLEIFRTHFLQGINELNLSINGDKIRSFPGIVNICLAGVKAEFLTMQLNELAFSVGSACHSKNKEVSHVLRAIGLSEEESHSSVRFSFGRYTTIDEIDFAVKAILLRARGEMLNSDILN